MRQIVTTSALLVLALIFTIVAPTGVSALNIKDLNYEVLSSTEVESIGTCDFINQPKIINNVATSTCLYENGQSSIGLYTDDRGVGRVAASYLPGEQLYPVKINGDLFTCQYLKCIYLSDSDTLLNIESLGSYHHYSPVLYKDFTKKLRINNNQWGTFFDYEEPDRQIMSSTTGGQAFSIRANAANVSNNGRWLVMEIMDVGLVRFDLKNNTHTRFYPDVLEHRTAPVADSEFAISDDGSEVFHMGVNVGIRRYKINSDCGDNVLENNQLSNHCQINYLNPSKLIWSMNYATKPQLTKNNSLRFFVRSYDPYLKPKQVHIGEIGSSASTLDFLSLGDSFTSGEGEAKDEYYLPGTNTEKEKCHVSARSYPFLVANKLQLHQQKTRNVACSGAVSQDVTGHDGYMGQRGRLRDLINPTLMLNSLQNQAKLEYLPGRIEQQYFVNSSKADIITIGIGGNDSGLMSKLNHCALPDTCKWADNDLYRAAVSREIKTLSQKLVRIYHDSQIASPKSRIFAVGYPQIIDRVESCSGIVGIMFNQKERIFMNEALTLINQVVKQSAQNAGINYIDIEDAISGHQLCSSTQTPAMNAIRLGDDIDVLKIGKFLGNESFHPTPFGHELIAEAIASQIPLNKVGNNSPVVSLMPAASEYWNEYFGQGFDIRYTDLLDMDDNDQETIKNTFSKDTDLYLDVKNLNTGQLTEEFSFNINDFVKPSEILSVKDWEEGVYGLRMSGFSGNGTQFEFYSTFIKNAPQEQNNLHNHNNSQEDNTSQESNSSHETGGDQESSDEESVSTSSNENAHPDESQDSSQHLVQVQTPTINDAQTQPATVPVYEIQEIDGRQLSAKTLTKHDMSILPDESLTANTERAVLGTSVTKKSGDKIITDAKKTTQNSPDKFQEQARSGASAKLTVLVKAMGLALLLIGLSIAILIAKRRI